jgi:hypothetical protein
MKYSSLLLLCVLAATVSFAQPATDALKNDNQTLRERYLVLKNKSEDYQEYKVIRESLLDAWWKIVLDSVQHKQNNIRTANASIAKLQAELAQNKQTLVEKEASMQDTVHASTHINVLGIEFNKGFFAGLVGTVILVLALAIGVIMYTLKMSRNTLKEKADLAEEISREFEEYKRKAMEKQTKLSRELQNERNKLQELGAL